METGLFFRTLIFELFRLEISDRRRVYGLVSLNLPFLTLLAEGKIFVGNLHEDVNQEELISAFLAHGAVVEYKFVHQFAFFTYDDTGKRLSVVLLQILVFSQNTKINLQHDQIKTNELNATTVNGDSRGSHLPID